LLPIGINSNRVTFLVITSERDFCALEHVYTSVLQPFRRVSDGQQKENPTMSRLHTGLRLRVAAVAVAIAAPFAFASAAHAEKSGQICAKAKVGTTAKDPSGATLTCTADGARSRWVGGSAPAATKAAPATPKTKTTKAPAAAATPTKKATSGGSTGAAGSAVKGRFCAKADDGKRDTNAKGEKLVCKADAAGKNRWQTA
jgi:hypothetical protein